MKFAAVASTLVFATLAAAQNPDPFIDTPTGVTTCLTSALTFGGTHPPFTVIIRGQASGTPIETIVSGTNDTTYSWLVNLDQGTYISLEIRDSLGNLQYSSPITVIAGTSTSCVGTTPSSSSVSSSSGAGSPSTSSSVSVSVASSTSSAASVSSSVASSVSSATSKASTSSTVSNASTASHTTSAAPTSTSGAAAHLDAGFGVAGLLGLIGAAIMV